MELYFSPLACSMATRIALYEAGAEAAFTRVDLKAKRVAESFPNAGLAPWDAGGRYRLQQWLSFIGAELHKLVFTPLLDRTSPDGAKEFARAKAALRLARIDA